MDEDREAPYETPFREATWRKGRPMGRPTPEQVKAALEKADPSHNWHYDTVFRSEFYALAAEVVALRAELAAAYDREAGTSDAYQDASASASGYRADRDRERAARETAERWASFYEDKVEAAEARAEGMTVIAEEWKARANHLQDALKHARGQLLGNIDRRTVADAIYDALAGSSAATPDVLEEADDAIRNALDILTGLTIHKTPKARIENAVAYLNSLLPLGSPAATKDTPNGLEQGTS